MNHRTLLLPPLLAALLATGVGAAPDERTVNAGLGPVPAGVSRTTPRDTVLGYLDACRAGDFGRAAHYLDLAAVPEARQPTEGPLLARRLKLVLDQKLWIDPGALSPEPSGNLDDELPPDQERIGRIALPAGEQSIRLERLGDGEDALWLFAPSSVRAIGPLYDAYGLGWVGDRLPPWLLRLRVWEVELWQLGGLLLLLPIAVLAGRALSALVGSLVASTARRTHARWDDELALLLRRPLRLFLAAAVFGVVAELLRLSVPAHHAVGVGVRTVMLVALGVFGAQAARVLGRALEIHLAGTETDPAKQRAVTTQIDVMRRLVSGVVVLVVAALALAQFEVVRTVGLSLLASAGLAGVIVGFAAQRSVANLFAGFQILMTQPIRIGDVVVVEGEWGTIEEINFTHVLVKIWDLRRLVVPIAYFLEKPFQNWTRVAPELLGTIHFYTDHTIDLQAMRAELDRVLAGTDLWDGQAKGLVVTGIKDHVVEVRALVSAADASKQWDLRCLVREKLLGWLQAHGSLPTLRMQMSPGGAGPGGLPEAH